MRFEVFQAFMDELGAALMEIKARTGAMIVWRTTFFVSGLGAWGKGGRGEGGLRGRLV